jgi:hypothetical protein
LYVLINHPKFWLGFRWLGTWPRRRLARLAIKSGEQRRVIWLVGNSATDALERDAHDAHVAILWLFARFSLVFDLEPRSRLDTALT